MSTVTIRREPDTIELNWSGRILAIDIENVLRQLDTLTLPAAPFLLNVLTAATGLDPEARAPTVKLARALRDRGVERCVCVGARTPLRLAATTAGMVVRMPIDFADDIQEARAFLRRHAAVAALKASR